MSRRVIFCRLEPEARMSSVPPPDNQALLQLVVSLASSGDVDAAASKAAGIRDRTTASGAWLAISRANANMQRWDAAERGLENALKLGTEFAVLQVERALLAERLGRHAEALDILESVARGGMPSPQW